MSSRGAEPHDHEPARQPTLAAYAPEPVLPPAASAPDWRSRQGRWVDRSLSGRHHLPWCRGLFRPVAKSNPCTIPRSKRQRPSYRSRPHTPNLWTVPLGGLDGLVFTAGIGERAPTIRAEICDRLAWLGVRLDATANAENAARISAPGSKIDVRVIATDEEVTIARHTKAVACDCETAAVMSI